jgi:hypothetical protein
LSALCGASLLRFSVEKVCRGELFACFSSSDDYNSRAFFLVNFTHCFCVVIFQNIKICPNCPLRKFPIGIFPIGIPIGIPLGKIPIGKISIGIFPTGIPIEI